MTDWLRGSSPTERGGRGDKYASATIVASGKDDLLLATEADSARKRERGGRARESERGGASRQRRLTSPRNQKQYIHGQHGKTGQKAARQTDRPRAPIPCQFFPAWLILSRSPSSRVRTYRPRVVLRASLKQAASRLSIAVCLSACLPACLPALPALLHACSLPACLPASCAARSAEEEGTRRRVVGCCCWCRGRARHGWLLLAQCGRRAVCKLALESCDWERASRDGAAAAHGTRGGRLREAWWKARRGARG
jgi:hypothetical protein